VHFRDSSHYLHYLPDEVLTKFGGSGSLDTLSYLIEHPGTSVAALTMTGSSAWLFEWPFDVVAAIYELVAVNESVNKLSGGVS
jgi:hypothetical protein